MNRKEEAIVIRDKVYSFLPDEIKKDFGDDVWAAAMYGAESYFKAQEEDYGYVEDILTMFRGNRTVPYMHYYFDKHVTIAEIFETLHSHGIPMPNWPIMKHQTMEKYFNGHVVLNVPVSICREMDTLKDKYGCSIGNRITKARTMSGTEVSAINAMLQDGYSVIDVAKHCDRGAAYVADVGHVRRHPTMLLAASMWDKCFSIDFISILLGIHRDTVLKYLHDTNCATFENEKNDYNVSMVNDADSGVRVGAMTQVDSDKIPAQFVGVCTPTEHEVRTALNATKGVSEKTRIERLSVMLGAPSSVVERMVELS